MADGCHIYDVTDGDGRCVFRVSTRLPMGAKCGKVICRAVSGSSVRILAAAISNNPPG